MVKKIYVNEEKRTCVVTLDCDGGHIVGKSKCMAGDTFNRELGVELAQKRAFVKLKTIDLEEFRANAEFFRTLMEIEEKKAEKCEKKLNEIKKEVAALEGR